MIMLQWRISLACSDASFSIGHLSTKAEVEQLIGEYVPFYNYEWINVKDGITPVEIRSKAAQSHEILRHALVFVSIDSGTVHFTYLLNRG